MDLGTWLAPALACTAMVGFGVQGVLVRRGLLLVDSPTGAVVSMGTTLLIFTVAGPFWMRTADWFTPAFWIFALGGCLHPVISMTLYYEAVRRTGATVASTFAATAPLIAAAVAVAAFGETLTPLRVLGTLLAVAGVIALSWSGGRIPPLMGSALLFASGTAVLRALSQNISKFGLSLTPNPLMAGFVAYGVSFSLAMGVLLLRRKGRPAKRPSRRGLAWCAAAGISGAVGMSSMYGALSVGDVLLVAPITAANPVVALVVGWIFGLETLPLRAKLAVLLTIAGVIAVVLGVPH